MKIRIVIIIAMVFLAAGLYLYFRQSPAEKVAREVLEGNYPTEKKVELTPELKEFVDWYDPMVQNASPEVAAIMRRFDPKYRSRSGHRNRELEELVPTDQWIQRHLDMGIKIENHDDYSDYLADRYAIYRAIKNPDRLPEKKAWHGLLSTATFDQFIEAEIRENVLNKQTLDQAMANDSKVYGGEFGADGSFIPLRRKTVYVQPGTITSGTGVPQWVVHELRDRDIGLPPKREIPQDIDVIYLDKKGQPQQTPSSVGEVGETPTFHRREPNTGEQSASEGSVMPNDFDNSDFADMPMPQEQKSPERGPSVQVPKSVADLEKQLTPEGIETELSEGVSPDRFDKAQQLIDEYGTEEGLRRLREIDPDAARQFERTQHEQEMNTEP